MGLFRTLRTTIRHPDPDRRVRAVRTSSDQAMLLRVATHDPCSSVRVAAVSRLTDHEVLADLVLTSGDASVRVVALSRISHLPTLLRLLEMSTDADVRKAAVERLDGDPQLVPLLDRGWSRDLVRTVVARICRREVIHGLALNHPRADVREAAAERGLPPELAAGVALKDSEPVVRRAALVHVHDATTLQTIAQQDPDVRVRETAEQRLRASAEMPPANTPGPARATSPDGVEVRRILKARRWEEAAAYAAATGTVETLLSAVREAIQHGQDAPLEAVVALRELGFPDEAYAFVRDEVVEPLWGRLQGAADTVRDAGASARCGVCGAVVSPAPQLEHPRVPHVSSLRWLARPSHLEPLDLRLVCRLGFVPPSDSRPPVLPSDGTRSVSGGTDVLPTAGVPICARCVGAIGVFLDAWIAGSDPRPASRSVATRQASH